MINLKHLNDTELSCYQFNSQKQYLRNEIELKNIVTEWKARH